MAYIEWDYTVITSMVEKQGWDLPDRESEEWNKFNDELGEKMRGVGPVSYTHLTLPTIFAV